MSSAEDKPSVGGDPQTAGSPYDEPTQAIERPRVRRPKPDNDSFFDKHGRRPSPGVQNAIDEKAARDEAADVDAPTETLPVTEPTEPVSTVGADEGDDAKTAVIVSSGAEAAAENPVKKSSSDEPVHTEPFVDEDDRSEEPEDRSRFAEHLTEPPLPYIEPQPTTPIDLDDEYEAGGPIVDDAAEPPVVGDVPVARRGTIDLGLLILRIAVGVTFTLHGLQKLTGWMNGPGPDGFAQYLANRPNPALGFHDSATTTLALVSGVSETAGGILLILGLLTPIAGAALLGGILVAMAYKATLAGGLWFFTADGAGNGLELEILLAAASAALILTGPGTYSFDRRWGWSRRPSWGSAAWVIVAIGAAVAVWILLNGANPLHSPGNPTT
ncbi:DoxX family protein [Gordonia neofelifaecis]|uniref:DoxX family protein n=1 Tax=Gordonia neofelifaecis NRRL B-59395 TaxID=644548 RepID=F1YEX8_9ACTN|nr:DoxX family protein [Gordonia neofelifaecis]EGD56961.1 DoxX family protein [Gordonia neofelifaecis NRRL B-59395]